jgi:hypothetical protein
MDAFDAYNQERTVLFSDIVELMPLPTMRVLGIFKLPVTEAMIREQTDILYPADNADVDRTAGERRCRELLESTVLVEVVVRNRDDRYSVSDFTQPRYGTPEGNWQVAYLETYLSLDGESWLDCDGLEAPSTKSFRIAFYIHDWNPALSLLSSYGGLECPAVQEMAERLRRLVPYELLD